MLIFARFTCPTHKSCAFTRGIARRCTNPLRGGVVHPDNQVQYCVTWNMADRTIQNIFLASTDYLDSMPQPLKNRKAIYAITHCRTENMGVSVYTCPQGHEPIHQYHSCRHRSCHLCAQKSRLQWIEHQRRRIFNTPHFHVVFTLPHEYLILWRYNEALFTRLMFRASQTTLQELIGDTKYHGVTPGVLSVLHTWGRQLDLHPHIHCLVTAGGLNGNSEWKGIDEYLLPCHVVKRVYRGKFQALLQEAFKEGGLTLPPSMTDEDFWRCYRSTYRKEWCVRIEDRYESGKGVMLYLARYLKGGPIHPKQIDHVGHHSIGFRYLDHRDKRVKSLRVKRSEFLRRLLLHIPTIGLHTVRFYGLYATCSKKRHQQCRELLGDLTEADQPPGFRLQDMVLFCRTCGSQARLSHRLWRSPKGNSINKEASPDGAWGMVQQNDQTDIARESLGGSP